jgi:hypothetical protein
MAEGLLLALFGLGGALLLAQGLEASPEAARRPALPARNHPDRRTRARVHRSRIRRYGTAVRPHYAATRQPDQHSGIASRRYAFTQRNGLQNVPLSDETAVTFVLVVGAALFMQTFSNLNREPRGFDADRLLRVRAPEPACGNRPPRRSRGLDLLCRVLQ